MEGHGPRKPYMLNQKEHYDSDRKLPGTKVQQLPIIKARSKVLISTINSNLVCGRAHVVSVYLMLPLSGAVLCLLALLMSNEWSPPASDVTFDLYHAPPLA